MRQTNLALSVLFALLVTTTSNPWLPIPQSAEKCETYEEDCGRGGSSDDEDPTRPGDPDGPDEPGDGL